MTIKLLLLVHFTSTCFMAGVIWIIQLVHYPMFRNVGSEAFSEYLAIHGTRITWVVFPLMSLELLTGFALLFHKNLPFDGKWALLGVTLIVLIWLSTAFLQVPLHRTLLEHGFNLDKIQSLVTTNWIRTALWTIRVVLVSYMLSYTIN